MVRVGRHKTRFCIIVQHDIAQSVLVSNSAGDAANALQAMTSEKLKCHKSLSIRDVCSPPFLDCSIMHTIGTRNAFIQGQAAAINGCETRLARGPLKRVGGMVALPLATPHCQNGFGTSEAPFFALSRRSGYCLTIPVSFSSNLQGISHGNFGKEERRGVDKFVLSRRWLGSCRGSNSQSSSKAGRAAPRGSPGTGQYSRRGCRAIPADPCQGNYPDHGTAEAGRPSRLPRSTQSQILTGDRAEFRYERTGAGFRLYSVGLDGIDQQGRGWGDDPEGDDLLRQIPMPALK